MCFIERRDVLAFLLVRNGEMEIQDSLYLKYNSILFAVGESPKL